METPGAATTETSGTEADAEAQGAPGADSAPADDDAVQETKKPGHELDSRIDELTGNWRSAERNAEHFRTRAERLEQELQEARQAQQQKPPEQQNTDDDAELKTLADFDFDEKKYAKYIRGIAEESADRKVKALRTELAEGRTAAEREIVVDEFHGKVTNWAKEQKVEDVEKMFAQPKDGGPNVTPTMADAIIDSEVGPALLHYLLKNRAEAVKICRMTPVQQAREIGRLEAKVQKAQPRTVSGAPAPAPRVDGGGAGSTNPKPDTGESDAMTDAEWTAARRKQLAGQRLAASRK